MGSFDRRFATPSVRAGVCVRYALRVSPVNTPACSIELSNQLYPLCLLGVVLLYPL